MFTKATNMQAYLKAGIMGFAGSGKTYTASEIALGLHSKIGSNVPVFFIDTETGSDWVLPKFQGKKIELHVLRSRAFADLIPALNEVEKVNGILIIDSITHFWREFTESYAKQRKRTRLQFEDWAYLKSKWAEFTDRYVNSKAHIILCGRAGYEYDYFVNEAGKKELEKTNIKMKAEGEMGYEPSLLILMERVMDMDSKHVSRVAHVLKDRSTTIDGKSFPNPTFKTFEPHIKWLNLGGEHVGFDESRNSDGIIEPVDREWQHISQQRTILLDEIETLLCEYFPSTGKDDKAAKIKHLKQAFGTAAWERIKTFKPQELKNGFESIKAALGQPSEPIVPVEPQPLTFGQVVPALSEDDIDWNKIEAEAQKRLEEKRQIAAVEG